MMSRLPRNFALIFSKTYKTSTRTSRTIPLSITTAAMAVVIVTMVDVIGTAVEMVVEMVGMVDTTTAMEVTSPLHRPVPVDNLLRHLALLITMLSTTVVLIHMLHTVATKITSLTASTTRLLLPSSNSKLLTVLLLRLHRQLTRRLHLLPQDRQIRHLLLVGLATVRYDGSVLSTSLF